MNSRRVLCFDSALRDIKKPIDSLQGRGSAISKSSNLGQKLLNLKNMTQSPYQMKNLAFATPLTAAMEMYNWLYGKVRKRNFYENNRFQFNLIAKNLELNDFFEKLGAEKMKEILEKQMVTYVKQFVELEFRNVIILFFI